MSEISEQLKARTMRFALDVCRLIQDLPHGEPGDTARRQLARSSTGLAFNYRASCRARSHPDFTSKIAMAAEEADESQGWLEFIAAGELLRSPEVERLYQESCELAAITSRAHGTARYNERCRRDGRRNRKDSA